MSRPLVWNGQHPIQEGEALLPPGRGELLVQVASTLCLAGAPVVPIAATGMVLDAGSQTTLGRDTAVVFRATQRASHVLVPESACFVPALPAEVAVHLPFVADLLLALDQAQPDLGWNARVTGDGALAERTLRLLAHAGARSIGRAGQPLPARGPVVFIDTSGRAAILQDVLDTMPPHGTLILAGQTGGDVTSINFYADVHKKNIRILGAAGGLERQRGPRAERLLERRLRMPELATVTARADDRPQIPDDDFVLRWAS